MLERMKWKGENMLDRGDSDDDNDGNEPMDGTNPSNMDEPKQKFNPENYCQLVWTGMAPKRMFNTFAFQSCPNAESARKVLEAKGVAHFWDQVVVHASGMGETFNFRLGL
jgi:U4/U6 small nuclear ribonucleoprotein PRP3